MSNFTTKILQASRAIGSESCTDASVRLTDSGGGKNSKETSAKDQRHFEKLYIATYNVRILRSESHLERLEEELLNIKWDILGISETGELATTLKSGHLLYQNNTETNDHLGGDAFLIHKRLKPRIVTTKSISEKVIYIVIKVNKRYNLQVIHVYAPTTSSDDETVEQLYEDITHAKTGENAKYVVMMGDFNAKIGRNYDTEIRHIGRFGSGEKNSWGEMLIKFCKTEDLYCVNSFFQNPETRRWNWKSPDGKVKNEIDSIILNKREICYNVSVLNKFDTNSDHRLVRATIRHETKFELTKMILKKQKYPTLEVRCIVRNREKFEKAVTTNL
ncbi:hypothetical protein HHI36_001991 [Cryptolaemus montrouzieri]|uniref:Endonuclease/exonuclease/phosphatase domain-containing protein n=1 Tax=Cryptolaemus montrouzieri TaxID=559131 RepID=A0ABD2P9V0_9CUCU